VISVRMVGRSAWKKFRRLAALRRSIHRFPLRGFRFFSCFFLGASVLGLAAVMGVLLSFPGRAAGQERFLDARSRGLAGISVPLAGSPAAFLWNPANLASLRQPAFGMNMNRLFAYDMVAVSDYRPPLGSIGLVAVRNTLAAGTGDSLGVGWARSLRAGLVWGGSVLFSREAQRKYGEMALGLRLQPSLLQGSSASRVTLFATATGLGRGSRFRFFLASKTTVLHQRAVWYSEWEISRRKSHLRNGLELFITPFLVARAGICDLNWKQFGWGLGLYLRNIHIDIAYSREEKRLQVSHVILFGYSPSERAENYYRQGLALLKQQKFLKAQEKFRYAVFYRPDEPEYRQVLRKVEQFNEKRRLQERELEQQALALENQGRFLAAYLKYHDLKEEFPQNQMAPAKMQMLESLARYELSLVKKKLAGLFQKGEYLTLKKVLDRISIVSPEDTTLQRYNRQVDARLRELGEKHYYTGLGYLSQKRFREAERELQQAFRYDPSLPRVQEYLSDVRKQLAAIAVQVDSLIQQAREAEQQKDYVRAAQNYANVLQLDPDAAVARDALKRLNPLIRAQIQKLLKRAETALKSDELTVAENLARKALRLEGEGDQARNLLQRIARRKKKLAAELAAEARLAFQNGHTQQAVLLYRRSLKLDPGNKVLAQRLKLAESRLDTEQRWMQAQAAFDANDFDQAEKIVVDLLAEHPDRKDYRNFLQKIRVSKSRYVTFLLQNGIHLYSQEKYAEAIRTFDRLLAVDPANQTAREYKKRTEEKIRALERLK